MSSVCPGEACRSSIRRAQSQASPDLYVPGGFVKRRQHNRASSDAVLPKQEPPGPLPKAEVRSAKPQVQHKTNSKVKLSKTIFLTPNFCREETRLEEILQQRTAFKCFGHTSILPQESGAPGQPMAKVGQVKMRR